MKFSIIIPFYNVERYIEECIRSVAEQDYPKDDFEIICVDDCSPDNSRDIVQRLMSEYPNLKLICHSENKHLGGARNTGIKNAKGDWIFFVDSDDKYITNTVLKTFKDLIDNVSEDVSFFKSEVYTSFVDSECNVRANVECNNLKILDGEKVLYSDFNLCCAWNGCWKKQFIIESNVMFREHVVYEDTDFGIKAGLYATKIGCIEYPFYGYRFNPESITNKPKLKTFKDNIASAYACYQLLHDADIEELARTGILKRIKRVMLSWPRFSRNYKIKESLSVIRACRKSEIMGEILAMPMPIKEKMILTSLKYLPIIPIGIVRIMVLFKRKLINK